MDQPEWGAVNEAYFYRPPTFSTTFYDSVMIPSDFAPGTYVLKYTLVDRVANQTLNHEAGFEVR